jgi:hypothetical protein
MIGRYSKLVLDPFFVRRAARSAARWMKLGSFEQRLSFGAVTRPYYAYCLFHGAKLAKQLGHHRVSVLEFGVAGGNGLVAFEQLAAEITEELGIEIDVYGFDLGEGLPEPVDYRDLPYHWQKGFYKMDVERLQERLQSATLVLGDVGVTTRDFFEKYDPAPIVAISYDLDFYSSTAAALAMLDAGHERYLPRVFCYFDDTIGGERELYSEFTGQRLAINEFNGAHPGTKLAQPSHLQTRPLAEAWHHQIWICHFFGHPQYDQFIGRPDRQLPLR